ncbi:glutamate synthase subunit beta [Ruminococcus sp. NK3A76]|uniref:glutamate synthase subunit beta n=1 Tax=Ruminococcus sp. NK3A76 TaxID=877411 RepID=UPI00048A892E|nr:glutamate synthase subunit beta [Ruminococcus sp. NK3A76]
MGKPTGFMEYERQENTAAAPLDRIKDFNDFHRPLDEQSRRQQAARCMNCGVPFCQNGQLIGGMMSGCPLNNLIPEWGELLYRGRPELALERLLMTNPFPEFTSRVCPALCEKACICGVNDSPVTVRDNERMIIEYGYENGLIKSIAEQHKTGKKIAVIGSGPSGLAAADMLSRRGHSVTVFEREDAVGGLLMYGIPNMKLEKDIISRRVKIMEQQGVEFRTSCNVGVDVSSQEIADEFDAVILACGASKPRDINAPGRDAKGVRFAVDYLKDCTKTLLSGSKPKEAKGKNVIVIGGGDTGNDCVGTAVRQGCKSVTQLEIMPKLPDERAADNPFPEWPKVCKTDYGQEEAAAVFGSDPRIYQTTVKEFIKDDNGALKAVKTVKLDFSSGRGVEVEGSEQTLPCEIALIAAGFLGCEEYVAEAFGAKLSERNRLTSEGHRIGGKLFCAGDAHIGQSLVVRAIREGIDCAREADEFLMGYTLL